jgi:hypothetical protein
MIFDPARASSAAASFAAILAAILLAVLGTLALSRDQSQGGRHKHAASLGLGFALLVALLATTYMFVLLSGLTPQPSDPAAAVGATPEQLVTAGAESALSLLRGAAFLFIVSGSALAVSAAGTLLFLGLALAESGSPASSVIRQAAHKALIGGIVVDGVLLAFGYDDIANAFLVNESRWAWTSISVVTLALPILLAVVLSRQQPQWMRAAASRLNGIRKDRLMLPGLFWLVALPVLCFLFASNNDFSGRQDYGGHVGPLVFSALCALWSGLSFAGCICLSRIKIHG